MTDSAPASLAEQRLQIRQRMQAQRGHIAHLLAPTESINPAYPRSHTMRLITRQPVLAAQLLTPIATFLLGARLIRTLSTAALLARALRTLAIRRQQLRLQQKPGIKV